MKIMTRLFLILFAILIVPTHLCAQMSSLGPSVVASAGNTSLGDNIQLDWTLGEVATLTIGNEDLLLTQGFHQPNYIITSNPDVLVSSQIEAYPNPVTEKLLIDFAFDDHHQVNVQLLNALGQTIRFYNVEGSIWIEEISMADLPVGNYFLHVFTKENKLFSRQIQKM